MSDSFKICAMGIAFAVVCVLIKNYRVEFLIPARLASLIAIMGVVIVLLYPIFEFLKGIMDETIPFEYIEILIKAIAITYMTQISSNLCHECGESSIAFGIETVGKIEIVILSLPLVNSIISMSKELLLW